MPTKGIILAGGRGTRLYPMTSVMSKQLQAVYDKPMFYYPLSTLMLAGIREIMIISTPKDLPFFRKILGDGSKLGISIEYAEQKQPKGLPEAFQIARDFIADSDVCMILGDNIFYGKLDFLRDAIKNNTGGTIFAYQIDDASMYGVVEFDSGGKILSIEEKPDFPKSDYAIPGLYIFNKDCVKFDDELLPGSRGEIEIIELQKRYLDEGNLKLQVIGRGIAWLDAGTPEMMLEAGSFIHAIEKRQGLKIACIEEIAFNEGLINKDNFISLVDEMSDCSYKDYCLKILNKI
ncbi:MAG: glucose-1-phosphate thymidylyltransferase RfbA [bacterium]